MSRPQNIYLRVVFYLLNKTFRAPQYDTVICHNCHFFAWGLGKRALYSLYRQSEA